MYGSYLQNHASHLFVFAAPDFAGEESLFPLAVTEPELFNGGLAIKALGNELCTKVGGRSIHPITAVVGGFTHEISPEEYIELADKLRDMRPFAEKVVDVFAAFPVPDIATKGDFLALREEGHYAVVSGRPCFAKDGFEFDCAQYRDYIEEYQVAHSLPRPKRVFVRRRSIRIPTTSPRLWSLWTCACVARQCCASLQKGRGRANRWTSSPGPVAASA